MKQINSEELVELYNYFYCKLDQEHDEALDNAIDAATDLTPVWIPVEERKPDEEYAAALAQGDEDVEVIAMIRGGDVATALRYDGDIGVFFTVEDGEFIAYTVTHWMPMPNPPKEEGHA